MTYVPKVCHNSSAVYHPSMHLDRDIWILSPHLSIKFPTCVPVLKFALYEIICFALYARYNKIKHVLTKYFIWLNKFYEEYSSVVKHSVKNTHLKKIHVNIPNVERCFTFFFWMIIIHEHCQVMLGYDD